MYFLQFGGFPLDINVGISGAAAVLEGLLESKMLGITNGEFHVPFERRGQ